MYLVELRSTVLLNMLRFWKISPNIFGTRYIQSLNISGTEYIMHMKIFYCMVPNIFQTLVQKIFSSRIYFRPQNSVNSRCGRYSRGSKVGAKYITQQHSAPEYIKKHEATAPKCTLISSVASHRITIFSWLFFYGIIFFKLLFCFPMRNIKMSFSFCTIFSPKYQVLIPIPQNSLLWSNFKIKITV